MKDEEVEQLVRKFLEGHPQHAKNTSFYIDSGEAVQVMPKRDRRTKRGDIPSHALALADVDDKGNIHVSPTPDAFERMYFMLLDYHVGKTSFLEMLARWEEVLRIRPRQAEFQRNSDEENTLP